MNIRTQKKRFAALADQLRDGFDMTKEQKDFLIAAFEKISNGFSSDEALGLKHTAGYSDKKEIAAKKNRLIIHWMACAMQPIEEEGLGLTLEQAIEAVIDLSEGQWTNPITKKTHIYKDKTGQPTSAFPRHSYDTLKKMWSKAGKMGYRSTDISALDENSPYPYKK
jgi:hypothetical protein